MKRRRITQDLVLSSTNISRSSSESTENFLKRVTHLHLQMKKLFEIDGLQICPNLKVLYLYDNLIDRIENLNSLKLLEYLQLQGNNIHVLPDICLSNLAKLFLSNNQITFIAGLENCIKLEHLAVSAQRLEVNQILQFDPKSLMAISSTLHTLEISGNKISILKPYQCLVNLKKLDASNNLVDDAIEVTELLTHLQLVDANFKGNPCCRSHKYRDMAIASSSSVLEILDDIPVTDLQYKVISRLVSDRTLRKNRNLKS